MRTLYSLKDAALIYLMSGALMVYQRKMNEKEEEVHLFTAYPGEMVGGLAVLTGEQSFYSIRTKHFSRIALISKSTIYGYVDLTPQLVGFASMMLTNISIILEFCENVHKSCCIWLIP